MVSKVTTVAITGFDGCIVSVEGDASRSLPSLQIVGLGNKAIDEAKERVRSAIANSLLEFPKKKITINLAPAELPKDGAHYDLPIAISILCLDRQIKQDEIEGCVFAGELSLDGSLRPIKGVINIAQTAKEHGFNTLYIPKENLSQASMIKDINIVGVSCLKDLYLHIKKEKLIVNAINHKNNIENNKEKSLKLDDINGQEQAKRAIIISVAGRHNIVLNGPPGTGKTMLARVLSELLPNLSDEESIETTKIHSMANKISDQIILKRPFRSPHHSASPVSIVGGGNHPKPGEISLAHNGVLFMDEFLEYPRSIIESLRQPLEDKRIDISRANMHINYPANFMLVATMNPCPCGYYGDKTKECTCSYNQILNYQKKLSGPILDRLDLFVNVSRIANKDLISNQSLSDNQHIEAQKIIKIVAEIQSLRYKSSTKYNANMTNQDIKLFANLSKEAEKLLLQASNKLMLSPRSYFKIIKVARTIADMSSSEYILDDHIYEAIQYRKH